MNTSGNSILIIGAASETGLEIAKQFSRKNNTIIMADKTRDVLEAEAAQCDCRQAAEYIPTRKAHLFFWFKYNKTYGKG